MTEMVNGEAINFETSSSNEAPVSQPVNNTASERTFRQSEVNDIVGRAKHEAIERFKRESSVESRNSYQQPVNYQNNAQAFDPRFNGMSEQEFRRMAAEEAQRAREEWALDQQRTAEEQNAQRIANEFFTKVGTGDGGLQEFQKKVADAGVDLRAIPYHVQLANMVDNTRDVMNELIDNPMKIGEIQNLIDIDLRAGSQPKLALKAIQRISESIKQNQSASKYRPANEPLSQLRPSNAGTDRPGALSVADYKAKYRV